MSKLWVRLSLAFSGVIILAILLMIVTGWLFNPDPRFQEDEPRQLSRAEFRERLPGVVLGMAAVIGVVGIGAGVWISRSLTSPLQELEEAAQAIGRRELGRRVQVDGSREMVAVGQAFNQMAAELERGEELRRKLMADVAHELRTPLSVLQGNLRAIIDDVYPLDKAEVARLYDHTRHLSRLVQDLHDLAQAEARELPLNRSEVDVTTLVQRAAQLFEPLAEEEAVTLQESYPDRQVPVDADAARLTQVVQNLLANALRHTAAGGSIGLSVSETEEAVQIVVRDSGEGIQAEHLPHVFDRFYRVDSSRSRGSGGAGLGLAIARAIVEAHGGTVDAASAGAGQGSTFTITLPRRPML
ncbi:MAG: sensor histidine kinase [Chloroflexota bacterium]